MIIRKAGLWKDEYISVSKEAGEQILANTPGTMEIPPEAVPQGPSLREAARHALTQKPLNVPETETASLDRQAGQLRAETDRMKAQTNLAKAQNEYDKSLQQLQQAQQPPQPYVQPQPESAMQAEQQPRQGMANLTASDVNIISRIRKRMDERRANGQFANAAHIAKPAPKTASERLHELMEGKKSRPFQAR
jgi:hypothetical protein